jgi:hypothetical protein
MQQGNQYHRFGYQPFNEPQAQVQPDSPQSHNREAYGRPPYAAGNTGYDEIGAGKAGIGSLLSSPLVMTGALIAAAVVFAGVLMVSYPSSDDIPQPIPIVQAESGPLKSEPAEAGGMEIANRDTTVFGAIDGKAAKDGARPVENLLETASSAEEQPMSKDELAAKLKTQGHKVVEEVASDDAPDAPVEALKEPGAKDAVDTAEASAKGIPLPRPERGPDAVPAVPMHEPGASPDTIAFVREVLGKKDEKTAAAIAATHKAGVVPAKDAGKDESLAADADKIAAIEPASGTSAAPVPEVAKAAPALVDASATPAKAPSAAGTHYVQVVSVPSKPAAESEWGKLQKSLSSVLGGAPYRIQEANLGEKGTYYRVQVGPFAEAEAKSLCQQVKAQKPGGCLVVH